MICPKDGYDCGNAKFCPECGEKLAGNTMNETKSQVWRIGMPCPYCGGTKLDGNCCAFCGAQLMQDIPVSKREFVSVGDIDLNIYFDKYKSSRASAIKALRSDTGVTLKEAKYLIDQVFDERMGKSHDRDISIAGHNLKDAIINTWRKRK